MNPADLKHRITIQAKTETADGLGGFTTSWTTFAGPLWAAVWPTSAKEIIQNQQLSGQVSHRVRIRYVAGVTSDMRILFGSRIFNILSEINPEERCEMLDLVCMEVV